MTFAQWLDSLFHPQRKPPPPAPTGLGAALLAAVNEARARYHQPPLIEDSRLDSAAAQHTLDMAASGVMSHQGFPQRLTAAGYPYRSAAENVAMGSDTAEATVQQWLDSPPHRANMLGAYQHMGGAGAMDTDERWWWCADFGTPR